MRVGGDNGYQYVISDEKNASKKGSGIRLYCCPNHKLHAGGN